MQRPSGHTSLPSGIIALLIGLAASVIALVLASVAPAGQPYDEPAHYANVLHYATFGSLPVLGEPGVRYEGQMGPGYYFPAAAILHVTETVTDALSGLKVLRLTGVAMVPVLAVATHAVVRSLGASRGQALLATALVSFNPGMLAIAASVQNDYLCFVVGAIASLVAIRSLTHDDRWRVVVLTGLLMGIAVLVKVFALGLLFGYVVAVMADSRSTLMIRLTRVGVVGASAMAVCGWWFIRNLRLYGDLTGSSAVERTGVSFPPLQFDGGHSFIAWLQSLVAYAFAPTEYYRNAFEVPTLGKAVAVACTIALLVCVIVGFVGGGSGRAKAAVRHEPGTCFALVAVLTVVGLYVVAAWSLQSIAPRLTFVVAPLAVYLLVRACHRPAGRAILWGTCALFVCADVWLVGMLQQLPSQQGTFPG